MNQAKKAFVTIIVGVIALIVVIIILGVTLVSIGGIR
jgi:predicted nucleic acid-binding Zn ribbon protein